MSKKEIYIWSSLISSTLLLGFYLIAVFGWPSPLEYYADYITGIFWKVLSIAITVEIILEILKEFQTKSQTENNHDLFVQAKGYRNAYYFLMIAIISLGVSLFLNDLLATETGEQQLFVAMPFVALHIIVAIFFLANITKSITQLYFYSTQQQLD
jgi:hypothetical protein